MEHLIDIGKLARRPATDVRPFSSACASYPALAAAYEICRCASLPEWIQPPGRAAIAEGDVIDAAKLVLTATQELLCDAFGDYLPGAARDDLWVAQATAVHAVEVCSDDQMWRDVQRDVAGGDKLLLICCGERWRRMTSVQWGEEWLPIRNGDGCGLVYRRLLGHRSSGSELGLTSYCPVCNKNRSALARKHRARVVKIRDHRFVLVPGYDEHRKFKAEVWVGHCKCGAEVVTDDLRRTRCAECREKHR